MLQKPLPFGGHLLFVRSALLTAPLGHILFSMARGRGRWSTKVSHQGHVGPARPVSFLKGTIE